MHIYTRGGDFGTTSNFNGDKVSKASLLIELQGGIDEVNSHVGHLRSLLNNHVCACKEQNIIEKLNDINNKMKQVQYHLFRIGSNITMNFTYPYIDESHVKELEDSIDLMVVETGKLTSFVYLSGHELASYSHVIRSTTRRAERQFVAYMQEFSATNKDFAIPKDYQYINRLADYFFQLARYLNVLFQVEEEEIH